MMKDAASAATADLRNQIERLEGRAAGKRKVLPFGVERIDGVLPGGGRPWRLA